MKTNTMLMGALLALLALPGLSAAQGEDATHDHGAMHPAPVQAALEDAKARVPRPHWHAIRESRVAAGAKSARGGTLVELDTALNLSVLVVLDENGTPHSECVESAPPQEANR